MKTNGINILVVDDDDDDRMALEEGIGEVMANYNVQKASNGMECLNLVKAGSIPDIVFMDLNMPFKNGMECLRDIHNQNLLPNTPIIIYSTSHHLKDITSASEYGARFYMVKPTCYSNLIHLLQRVIYLLGRPLEEQKMKKNFVLDFKKLQAA